MGTIHRLCNKTYRCVWVEIIGWKVTGTPNRHSSFHSFWNRGLRYSVASKGNECKALPIFSRIVKQKHDDVTRIGLSHVLRQSVGRSLGLLSNSLVFKRLLHIQNIIGDPEPEKFTFMSKRRIFDFFGHHFEFSISVLCGHLSFLILAMSFILHELVYLRILACFAGILTMLFTYYHPHGRVMWLPFGWNVIFVIINVLHIMYYYIEVFRANNLKPEEEELLETVFDYTGISRVDFLKLARAATWEEFPVGAQLTTAGVQNSRVLLISKGRAKVVISGEQVYVLEMGNFIGEMGLHVGLHISGPLASSATVTALTPIRCLVWKRGALIDLLEHNPSLQRCIQASITADLMRKLKANAHLKDQADSSPHLHQKSHFEYRNLLQYLVKKSEITAHDRNILKRYRTIHFLSEKEHEQILSDFGWTVEEYESGSKMILPDPSTHSSRSVSHPLLS